jgi:hypothetical protein
MQSIPTFFLRPPSKQLSTVPSRRVLVNQARTDMISMPSQRHVFPFKLQTDAGSSSSAVRGHSESLIGMRLSVFHCKHPLTNG